MVPDPDFRTLKSPNPEDGHAFARSVSLARTQKATLVVTDPDADRLGVVVKYKHRFKIFERKPSRRSLLRLLN